MAAAATFVAGNEKLGRIAFGSIGGLQTESAEACGGARPASAGLFLRAPGATSLRFLEGLEDASAICLGRIGFEGDSERLEVDGPIRATKPQD